MCRGDVPAKSPCTPFCSERCRSLDLARWLGGNYRLPGEYVDPEMIVGMMPAPEPAPLRPAPKKRERH